MRVSVCRRAPLLMVAGFVALSVRSARAQEVRGFAEFRAQATTGVDGEKIQLVERFRPDFTAEISERITLSATLEVALTQGRSLQKEVERTITESPLGPILDEAGCVWPEDANNTLSVSFASDYLSVDRLYLDAYLPWADVRVGRQAVNWGSAFVVNPTSPFPEVLLLDPWRPRAGVNALRGTVPIGEQAELQVVIGSNDDFTAVRTAGRASVTIDVTDLSLVGAWRQETKDGIVGADVRGTFGVGYWLEAALHLGVDGFEEVAVGVDYSFAVLERLLVTAQYYRNGNGTPEVPLMQAATNLTRAVQLPDCDVDLFWPRPMVMAGTRAFFRGFRDAITSCFPFRLASFLKSARRLSGSRIWAMAPRFSYR